MKNAHAFHYNDSPLQHKKYKVMKMMSNSITFRISSTKTNFNYFPKTNTNFPFLNNKIPICFIRRKRPGFYTRPQNTLDLHRQYPSAFFNFSISLFSYCFYFLNTTHPPTPAKHPPNNKIHTPFIPLSPVFGKPFSPLTGSEVFSSKLLSSGPEGFPSK